MADEGSVTQLIHQLQGKDRAAVQPLWDRYFQRLVGLARKKLLGAPQRLADEEDLALSAFDSFCRGAEEGRFTKLRDRENLWPLLVLITVRKVADFIKHETGPTHEPVPLVGKSHEPSSEFAVQVVDEYRRLLDALGEAELRVIAQRKLEGYTNEEIAAELGCVERTVERKLRTIRSIWEKYGALPPG